MLDVKVGQAMYDDEHWGNEAKSTPAEDRVGLHQRDIETWPGGC